MSLNVGYINAGNAVSTDDRLLIDNYLKNKGAKICPPANLTGNEISRSSKELIASKRREYRKKLKEA